MKKKEIKCELYHDNFQNYKRYAIPKAQLIIADIPYNLGINAYASNPQWYNDGDRMKGESELAAKSFFNGDGNFNLIEFIHFSNTMLKKEPKNRNEAGAMIIFCAFEQAQELINIGKRYGFNHGYPIFFIKNYSSQVLKANQKIVGATEQAVVLYRNKLPKFRNEEKGMIKNWFDWPREFNTVKIHPTQKPIALLKNLIEIFTDEGDVIIDPVAGSGSTLRAAKELGRPSFGFEVSRDFYKLAKEKMIETRFIDKRIAARGAKPLF